MRSVQKTGVSHQSVASGSFYKPSFHCKDLTDFIYLLDLFSSNVNLEVLHGGEKLCTLPMLVGS